MTSEELANYTLWVKLANDPSQSEEARRQYRDRMEAYVRERMRSAFQMATRSVTADAETP